MCRAWRFGRRGGFLGSRSVQLARPFARLSSQAVATPSVLSTHTFRSLSVSRARPSAALLPLAGGGKRRRAATAAAAQKAPSLAPALPPLTTHIARSRKRSLHRITRAPSEKTTRPTRNQTLAAPPPPLFRRPRAHKPLRAATRSLPSARPRYCAKCSPHRLIQGIPRPRANRPRLRDTAREPSLAPPTLFVASRPTPAMADTNGGGVAVVKVTQEQLGITAA